VGTLAASAVKNKCCCTTRNPRTCSRAAVPGKATRRVAKFSPQWRACLAVRRRGCWTPRRSSGVWNIRSRSADYEIGDELDEVRPLEHQFSDQNHIDRTRRSGRVVRISRLKQANLLHENSEAHPTGYQALEFSSDSVLLATGDRRRRSASLGGWTGTEYLNLERSHRGITKRARGEALEVVGVRKRGIRRFAMGNGKRRRSQELGRNYGAGAIERREFSRDVGLFFLCGRDRIPKALGIKTGPTNCL